MVNGPLGRNRYCPRASSFFVKTDVELHRMVKNFYDSGFGESSADEKPEMSQEEIRFLNVLDSTIALRSGHYEMAFSLRDQEAPVPNNRLQAERRALWSRRKLERDSGLYSDYKCFMADIIEKGYARKVSADFQRSSVKWYIPHHGVYHRHKPGNIGVVFYCSAKYRGMLLNDQLLKGPDLTNSLFGVLSRFRQERIALMADIEAMFYIRLE